MAVVNVPGVGSVNFPDDMSPQEMQRAIEVDILPKLKQPADAMSRTKTAIGGVNRGIAGLAGLPVDTGENIINLGLTGYGAIKNLITGRKDSPPVLRGSFGGSQQIASLMERGGAQASNTHPEDMASRMLFTGGQIAGGSLVPGARPVSTAAAAAGGAVASEIDPSLTALGAMAPATVGAGSNALRSAAATRTSQNAQTFKKAGANPSVGMATDSNFVHGIENLLSKFPGGTGVFTKFREKFQADIGKKATTGISAEDAGRAIERGITGKGGFLETTKAKWKQLDDAVAAKVPKGTQVIPFETKQALDELTTPTQGAERTTGGMANQVLVKMRDNLEADMAANNGRISFEGLRKIRTDVGTIQENSIVSGVAVGQAKRLYGALSRDLEAAAGSGGAAREFSRQNDYYTARMGRIERVLDRVIGNGKQPEDIFKTFYPTDQNQANKVRATMRSLPADERRIVSQAAVDRLGRATPGKQNETGTIFSTETFLTNWNKLSPGAKSALFPDHKMRANLEAIASGAGKVRHGSSSMSNPSGTAGSFAGYSIYLAPFAALAYLDPTVAVTAGTLAGTAHLSARLLTSPRFVEWLARGPQKDPKAIAAHLARLGVIYNATDDEALKSDLEQYIQSMNGEQ